MTLDDLISNFELFDNWEDRYAYLIDLGKKLPSMKDEDRTEENRVKGCQATVWLKENVDGDTIEFAADSNSAIVKGLVSILVMIYSGQTAEEILKTDASPTFAKLGLDQHLSPTRKIGLHAMMQQIQKIATDHSSPGQ